VLENVPPGDLEISAWHEIFGRVTQKVKLEAKGTANAELVLPGK